MADLPDNPNNREEEYLADIAGLPNDVPDNPWSRKEAYLAAISGRLDGIDEKIAALATDISLKGGVDDYDHLPDDAAIGDAYITEDTGILYVWVGDEWTPLNMQGGGGGTGKELTSADYNFHKNGSVDDGVAVWLIPAGAYVTDGTVKVYTANNDSAYPKSFTTYYNNNSTYGYVVFSHPDNDKLAGKQLTWSNGLAIRQFYMSDIPAISQTTGTSTAAVMSQDATSSLVYALHNGNYDKENIRIGGGGSGQAIGAQPISIGYSARVSGSRGVAIGYDAQVTIDGGLALGESTKVTGQGGIALGAKTTCNTQGVINVAPSSYSYGYNNTFYRLLSGLHDPQSAHDAATKGYVDAHAGGDSAAFYCQEDFFNPTGDPASLYKDSGFTQEANVTDFYNALVSGSPVVIYCLWPSASCSCITISRAEFPPTMSQTNLDNYPISATYTDGLGTGDITLVSMGDTITPTSTGVFMFSYSSNF